MKWCILKNELPDSHIHWEAACKKFNQEYDVIDITRYDWLECIQSQSFDGFLACPSGLSTRFKILYDERIYILNKVLNRFCYPSYDEIAIHENKKFLAYWLDANNVPHQKTYIVYNKDEALKLVTTLDLPLVVKANIGASGKGVKILSDRGSLIKYVHQVFSSGSRQQWWPNIRMGDLIKRVKKVLRSRDLIKRRLKTYRDAYNEVQIGYLNLQEFVPHNYEWRIIRIGESYFGHQKIKIGDKASGSKGIDYTTPPPEYLTFVKELCEKHGFNSMAVDLFEDGKGGVLVNEMQTIFGHVQDYVCEMNGKPGRFIHKNNEWIFEPGNFNTNLSYDLRLANAIDVFGNKA